MKKTFFVLAAAMVSSQLSAQDSAQSRQLDEVVVTANKYPQKQSSTGKVLTVITREQLLRNSGRTLAQVLNEQAGLVVNGAQGPLGTNQLLYLRGAGTASTLILIDGVPANDASGITAEFDINHLVIDQIERVEILKGSQSVLYGSDAVAGVINIITRAASTKKISANANLAAGSYGTWKTTGGLAGASGILNYRAQYSHVRSDGFSAAHDPNNTGTFDRDGFRQDAVSVQLGLTPTSQWQLNSSLRYDDYRSDIDDGAFQDDKNNTLHNKNLQVIINSVNKFAAGDFHVNLGLNNIDRRLDDEKNIPADPNDFDPFHGRYKGEVVFGEAFTNLSLQQHVGLLIGTDIRSQKADINTTYGDLGSDSLHATQFSGYASLFLKNLRGFNVELGSRYTHHSQFGSNVTWSVNPSFLLKRQWKLFANLSTGFRAPSLYNLASEYGNPSLKPERSLSAEGGVQYFNTKNTVNLRITAFNRRVNDLIVFTSLFTAPYGRYNNADRQDDHGLELEATLVPATHWRITANYTYTDGKLRTISSSTSKDTSYYNLYRRPKHAANANLGYELSKKWYVSMGLRWVDKRTDLYFNPNSFATEPVVLAAFYNVDAYASYQATRNMRLFADLRNITNQDYQELYGYNSRRFNFMAGINLSF